MTDHYPSNEQNGGASLTHKYTTLKKRCLDSIEDFQTEGEVVKTPVGNYIFKDNGANILAVAHLDTVATSRHFHVVEMWDDQVVLSGQLDDRLGAWVILDVLKLPSMGEMKYDILLTEGEETGQDTAAYFTPPDGKQYNWGFEFDRMGEDVVLYHYDNPDLRNRLKDAGFVIGNGSVSDISYLEHLGCEFFNIGVGYHDYHSPRGYALLSQTARQIARFRKYYDAHKDTFYEHTPYVAPPVKTYEHYNRGEYGWVEKGDGTWTWDKVQSPLFGARNSYSPEVICDECGITYRRYTNDGRSIRETGLCIRCAGELRALADAAGDTVQFTVNTRDEEADAHYSKVYILCDDCHREFDINSGDGINIDETGACISCELRRNGRGTT